jgi:hypothetical protein
MERPIASAGSMPLGAGYDLDAPSLSVLMESNVIGFHDQPAEGNIEYRAVLFILD